MNQIRSYKSFTEKNSGTLVEPKLKILLPQGRETLKMKTMKNLFCYLMLVLFFFHVSTLSAQEEEAPLSDVMREYTDIKQALVADQFAVVKQEVPFLKKELADLALKEGHAALLESVDLLAMASDLKAQREAFALLSKAVLELVKEEDYEQTLFWQVCPMALGGKGAGWLSLEEKVNNPFMGQKMPHCGKVQEVLK